MTRKLLLALTFISVAPRVAENMPPDCTEQKKEKTKERKKDLSLRSHMKVPNLIANTSCNIILLTAIPNNQLQVKLFIYNIKQ